MTYQETAATNARRPSIRCFLLAVSFGECLVLGSAPRNDRPPNGLEASGICTGATLVDLYGFSLRSKAGTNLYASYCIEARFYCGVVTPTTW